MLGNSLAVGKRTLDYPSRNELVSEFLESRRQELSAKTIHFYQGYLQRSILVISLTATGQEITSFLHSLQCTNSGKHAYFRTLKTFYNWLYSSKSGHGLNYQSNPMLVVDAPKREKRILPSITDEQLSILVLKAECLRDKVIICLLFDSGMRLSELASIKHDDIDWNNQTISIVGKGSKQRRAPFTQSTA